MKITENTWVEWIEPYGPKNEPVYMRVPAKTAIAVMKKMHKAYTDEKALEDFATVNFAKVYESNARDGRIG